MSIARAGFECVTAGAPLAVASDGGGERQFGRCSERWTTGAAASEVGFHFATRPEGSGDLTIALRAQLGPAGAPMAVTSDARGLRFGAGRRSVSVRARDLGRRGRQPHAGRGALDGRHDPADRAGGGAGDQPLPGSPRSRRGARPGHRHPGARPRLGRHRSRHRLRRHELPGHVRGSPAHPRGARRSRGQRARLRLDRLRRGRAAAVHAQRRVRRRSLPGLLVARRRHQPVDPRPAPRHRRQPGRHDQLLHLVGRIDLCGGGLDRRQLPRGLEQPGRFARRARRDDRRRPARSFPAPSGRCR